MATKEQIRELLKAELRPINGKLEVIEAKFNDLQTAVDFLSTKYDTLLSPTSTEFEREAPGLDFDLKEPKEGYPRCAENSRESSKRF